MADTKPSLPTMGFCVSVNFSYGQLDHNYVTYCGLRYCRIQNHGKVANFHLVNHTECVMKNQGFRAITAPTRSF
jgi:hypothetical protein